MNSNIYPVLLQSLFVQLPVILVALVACIVTVLNWQQSSSASTFSLLGFGLTLLLCFAIPIGQVAAQSWLAGKPVSDTRFVYEALGIFWAVLRAAAYALLLTAIYTGRPEQRSAPISYPPVPPA